MKNERINHIHALSTTTVATMAHILSQKKFHGVSRYILHRYYCQIIGELLRFLLIALHTAEQCQITAEDLLKYLGDNYANKIKSVHLGVNINSIDKK